MIKKHKIVVVLAAVLMSAIASWASAGASLEDALGRSATPLADGRILLVGGFDSQSVPTADALIASADGSSSRLPAGLNFARAGHTATMLPDGTIFIFGGVGANGELVSTSEIFDPATQLFSVLADVFAVPRAFHTATLLTDGTLLLAGGVEAGGEFPDDVQLWDYRTRKALSHHALLAIPREGQTAVLRADGAVRVAGGTDRFGRPAAADEIFDPITKRFHFAGSADTEAGSSLHIAASIPEDGAIDVPIQTVITIRFTQLLAVSSINQVNFVLVGPNESSVDAKVTPAENGRLAFVLPSAPLQPGTSYSLRMKNAA